MIPEFRAAGCCLDGLSWTGSCPSLGLKAEGKRKPVTPRIRKGEMPTLTDFRRPDLRARATQPSGMLQ